MNRVGAKGLLNSSQWWAPYKTVISRSFWKLMAWLGQFPQVTCDQVTTSTHQDLMIRMSSPVSSFYSQLFQLMYIICASPVCSSAFLHFMMWDHWSAYCEPASYPNDSGIKKNMKPLSLYETEETHRSSTSDASEPKYIFQVFLFHLCRTWGPAKYQNKCNFYNSSRFVVSLGELRLVDKGYILADVV